MISVDVLSFLTHCGVIFRVTLSALMILVLLSCEKPVPPPVIPVDITSNEHIIDGVVHFKTSTTYPKAANLVWSWDFGDETSDPHTTTLANPTHVYSRSGEFLVTLKVTDPIEQKEQIIKKRMDVRYFNDRPSAKIIKVTTSIFSSTIRCNLHSGTKYEYQEPEPEFFLEVSESTDFQTLIPISSSREKTIRLQPFSVVEFVAIGLSPNTTYYARVRAVRKSFLKQGAPLMQVSDSPSPIFTFKTDVFPSVEIDVDTITNPELIIIKSSIPQMLFAVGEVTKTLTVYKDNDMNTPYKPVYLFPDSVLYREPGATLTFVYTYTYLSNLTGKEHQFDGTAIIYTPNVLMGIDDVIYRADAIPTISALNTSINNSRRIQFADFNVTIQLNQSVADGQPYVMTDEFGIPIRAPRTHNDKYSYLTIGFNNVSYYHVGGDAGNLYIYKEDDKYIYVRMTQAQVLSSYRKGFLMANAGGSNSQQSARELLFKGLVFKAAKPSN